MIHVLRASLVVWCTQCCVLWYYISKIVLSVYEISICLYLMELTCYAYHVEQIKALLLLVIS